MDYNKISAEQVNLIIGMAPHCLMVDFFHNPRQFAIIMNQIAKGMWTYLLKSYTGGYE